MPSVFEDPTLITSLSTFSYARLATLSDLDIQQSNLQKAPLSKPKRPDQTSVLFLQVFAAADYFTVNKTLMENVPPVYIDVILDPYVLNVFPRSLVPTAVYILILAVGSWYFSDIVWKVIAGFARPSGEDDSATENAPLREKKKER